MLPPHLSLLLLLLPLSCLPATLWGQPAVSDSPVIARPLAPISAAKPSPEGGTAPVAGAPADGCCCDDPTCTGCGASAHSGHHHGALAPIAVSGDHLHAQGEWMLTYRFGVMDMRGNRAGHHRVSTSEVLSEFMVAPLSMRMEMHMLGAMLAVDDDLTLMAMLPWKRLSMRHVTRMGATFHTRSEGPGDVRLSALHALARGEDASLHIQAGLSLPTGSIDERGDTPAALDTRLPYPMQLGSGTFDLLPGVTLTSHRGTWSWGAQAVATLRLGRNANGYALGDRLALTSWASRRLTSWLGASLRVAASTWGDVRGADDSLNRALVPTAAPHSRGGNLVELGIGVDAQLPGTGLGGPLAGGHGSRLGIEVLAPLLQELDGPQLERDWTVMAGLQLVW